ncbi:MAG: peptide chain release factor N(5)-glutamine methyltransferase, partial [Planctomycetes bacterium]|nr:peptide chain release factor N(5)-glutamine methyltransferase [Planctomycetota bacterium]
MFDCVDSLVVSGEKRAVLLLQETMQKSVAFLLERGIENGRREAEWIFSECLGLSRMELYTQFDMPLTNVQEMELRALIVRRGKREPLAYVLGTQDFCGLTLKVTPAALVPRPETEELVEEILRRCDSTAARVADIGTGSGAIALALKKNRSEWEVHASDLSAEALQLAEENAADLQLAVKFHQGHLHHPCVGVFDVVVANLPYIAEEERELCDPELAFEPQMALFADDCGLL